MRKTRVRCLCCLLASMIGMVVTVVAIIHLNSEEKDDKWYLRTVQRGRMISENLVHATQTGSSASIGTGVAPVSVVDSSMNSREIYDYAQIHGPWVTCDCDEEPNAALRSDLVNLAHVSDGLVIYFTPSGGVIRVRDSDFPASRNSLFCSYLSFEDLLFRRRPDYVRWCDRMQFMHGETHYRNGRLSRIGGEQGEVIFSYPADNEMHCRFTNQAYEDWHLSVDGAGTATLVTFMSTETASDNGLNAK